MNIADSIDEYIKERWNDIIELLALNNNIEMKLSFFNEISEINDYNIVESIKTNDGNKIADIYIKSDENIDMKRIKTIIDKLKEIILKDIKISNVLKISEENYNFKKGNKILQKLEFLSLLPESNPNIVVITNCDGEIVYSNKSSIKWLNENNFENQNDIKILFPNEFKNKFCDHCKEFNYKGEKIEFKNQVFDFKIKPIPQNEKCMITLTDISETERLYREKELYYKAFQSSIHGMIITDKKGYIEYVNPKFLDLYGYSSNEVIGKGPNILNPGMDKYYDLGYPKEKYLKIFSSLWESISNPNIGYWEGIIPNQKKMEKLYGSI